MTSTPTPQATDQTAPPVGLLIGLFLVLFVARLFAAGYGRFIENDEASLAAGVATIVRGGGGDIYRYGPQIGYYQLVAWLTRVAGGDIMAVPLIQVTISAFVGALLPLMGFFAYRDDRTRLERWLTVFTLAASPLLWMSSRYGSSAMTALPFASAALVILSNRPRPAGEFLALGLLGVAILVRADAVLVLPGAGMMMWHNRQSFRQAALRLGSAAAVVGAIYVLLFLFDPLTRSLGNDVAGHLNSPTETMFWEYLLWGTSPFAFVLAIVGARALFADRPWMAWSLTAWSLPVFAFYYVATTQPRYFLLTVLPLAIATAAGMAAIVEGARRYRRVAIAATVAVCSLHLFVGLGRFSPGHRRGYLLESTITTHTGPLWTGALLYKSFIQQRLWNAPVLHPRFGSGTPVETASVTVFGELADGVYRGRHVLLIMDPGFGNVMHFYAQAAGVRIVSQSPGHLWYRRFDMTLGEARLTMLGVRQIQTDSALALPVDEGDEVWMYLREPPVLTSLPGHLPPGLALARGGARPDLPRLWRFHVVKAG